VAACVIAVVHDVSLDQAQLRALARLLRDNRDSRPDAVVARLLWHDGRQAQLIAIWESRDALDRHLATAAAAPISEMLSPLLGETPPPRIVEIDKYG
jgi:quinol monooxygenase YgiN